VELAGWAAWRWAGPLTRFLRTASPPTAVLGLPPRHGRAVAVDGAEGVTVERVPPAGDVLPLVGKVAARGDALVLAPSLDEAAMVAAHLRQAGHPVAVVPREWARAAAGGCTVVGSRAGAWAPVPALAGVVVLDEHDEAYQEERAPTWNARDVAIERARRAGVPCVLASPCPSLVALAAGPLVVPSRTDERNGWPVVEVVDRRQEPPGSGLYSSRVVELIRGADLDARAVCVLNRKGRAVLLACAACGELARCEVCDGSLESQESGLRCRRCGAEQPAVCRWCGGTKFKALRIGVSRARDELELLAGQPVAEVTGESDAAPPPWPAVVVGTEAVLHRVAGARTAVFLDFDQELLAPRYRAGEQALTLLARAGRMVGGRDGRVVVQTRLPTHEVLDAALHADPERLAVVEGARRAALRLPPETALARISGPGAGVVVEGLERHLGLEVSGPSGDRWLVRAADHQVLCGALAAVPRPEERVRIEVDPLRA
jgi:primosomal protein N' (replication factor Y)